MRCIIHVFFVLTADVYNRNNRPMTREDWTKATIVPVFVPVFVPIILVEHVR